jgi:hypothetical protein
MSTKLESSSSERVARTAEVGRVETSATSDRSIRRMLIIVASAAALFVAGLGTGWLLRGDDGASPPSYVMRGAVVAGDELTERQLEMVDVTQQYVEAFIAKDGEAVASFMAPDGYLALPTLGDQVLRAEDGTLQEWVEDLGMIPNELNQPIVVRGDQVVLTGHLDALDADWMMVIEFTSSGEVKIASDTHWAS